jgi:nicotinate phosphoribosyltransferase
MIKSILDNDLYKFTMQQAVHMLYPRAQAQYEFINRGLTPFPDGFALKVKDEIEKMAVLKLSMDQKAFLEKVCYFLTPVYLDYLESYRYDPGEVTIEQDKDILTLKIVGPWYRTILWEIPIMAIISEAFFKMTHQQTVTDEERQSINLKKARLLGTNSVKFADFGTRRRFSAKNQEEFIKDVLSHENHTLIGTSNVHFSQQFNITPIGTLAHEWFMFHAASQGYEMANSSAQDAWVKVFHGDLGIALTDTYTTDVFLSTFDTFNAKLFDGVRQDSGEPLLFMDKIIQHYKRLHIDPSAKTIVFSDGLDVETAVKIHKYCNGRVRDAYGIGTYLTNDVGVVPLNMVIKLTKCRASKDKPWRNAVKLSDDRGKQTGDPEELKNCRSIFHISEG